MGLKDRLAEFKESLDWKNNLGVVVEDYWDLRDSGIYYVWVARYNHNGFKGFNVDSIKRVSLTRSVLDARSSRDDLKRGTIVTQAAFGLWLFKVDDRQLKEAGFNGMVMKGDFTNWFDTNIEEIRKKIVL